MHMRKPIIGIPADRRLLNSHWFHCVGEKYINAIVQAADAVPVLVPALGARLTVDGVQARGLPWKREREGRPFSTCALAFSESWTEAR